ncbi:hypothetical protein HY213_05385 [Candidatus Peregrinibacteria bacterium]|nr:hypothetical protein [Candidatus Peregrinibacteria bacterium]
MKCSMFIIVFFLSFAIFLPLVPDSHAAMIATKPTLCVSVFPPSTGGVVPQGAQRVPMLTLHLQASCGAPVMISGLTLRHVGFGAVSDLQSVYALAGVRRISRGLSVSARDPLHLRVGGVTVPACESLDLTVDADFSSTAQAAAEHGFALVSVETSGTAVVSLVAQQTLPVRNIVPSATSATITAQLLPVLTSIEYGANMVVARLSLASTGTDDQQILAITFHNDGSASDHDLQNFFLETNSGERVSQIVPQMDGRSSAFHSIPRSFLPAANSSSSISAPTSAPAAAVPFAGSSKNPPMWR